MTRKKIFKITDPQGRGVVFYDDTWRHIKSRHRDITRFQRIKTTVMKPDIILQSSLINSLIYIDCTQLSIYFNVFTKYDETLNECTVSTAYFKKDLPNGEIIWEQSK